MHLKQMRRLRKLTQLWLVCQTLKNEDNMIKWAIVMYLREESRQEGLEIITDRTTGITSIEVISEAMMMMILFPLRTSSNSCFSGSDHVLVQEEISSNNNHDAMPTKDKMEIKRKTFS